jgi:hypothetical protein
VRLPFRHTGTDCLQAIGGFAAASSTNFAKVSGGRKQPIRGPWKRNGTPPRATWCREVNADSSRTAQILPSAVTAFQI